MCKEALQQKVVVLVSLEEIVKLLERDSDLVGFLKKKVAFAVNEKRPWVKLSPRE